MVEGQTMTTTETETPGQNVYYVARIGPVGTTLKNRAVVQVDPQDKDLGVEALVDKYITNSNPDQMANVQLKTRLAEARDFMVNAPRPRILYLAEREGKKGSITLGPYDPVSNYWEASERTVGGNIVLYNYLNIGLSVANEGGLENYL